MRKGMFSIDTYGDLPLPGWTEGRHWNGWAMPLFEATVAWEIVFRQNTVALNSAWYDEKADEFCFRLDDGDPERYGGVDVAIDDGNLKLYAIGSGTWIWEEAEDQEQD